MRETFNFLLAALSIGLAPGAASAQTAEGFPNKPIRFIAPIPPGGSTDVLLRDVARRLQERWGQPAVVENKPGGAAQHRHGRAWRARRPTATRCCWSTQATRSTATSTRSCPSTR